MADAAVRPGRAGVFLFFRRKRRQTACLGWRDGFHLLVPLEICRFQAPRDGSTYQWRTSGVALHLNRRLRYYFCGPSSALTLWPSFPNGNLPPTRIGHSRQPREAVIGPVSSEIICEYEAV